MCPSPIGKKSFFLLMFYDLYYDLYLIKFVYTIISFSFEKDGEGLLVGYSVQGYLH